MRADEGALVALDAVCCLPFRYFHGSSAFFVLRRASRPGPIFEPVLGHGRNGEDFTFLTVHDVDDFLDKGWGFVLLGSILSIFPVFGNSDAVELVDAVIDGGIVLIDNSLTLLDKVGLIDGFLHGLDGFFHRNDAKELKESSLKDRIGAVAKADGTSNGRCVDGIEFGFFGIKGALHGSRQVPVKVFIAPGAVKKECAAFFEVLHHIIFCHVARCMAGNKICGLDEVRAADGVPAKTQVTLSKTARFLGIIDEVGLAVEVRRVANNLDGVFIGADRPVRPHAPEFSAHLTFRCRVDGLGLG